MKSSNNKARRGWLIGALVLLIFGLLFLLCRFWLFPSAQEPTTLIPLDGLVRGEVYFYGESDDEIRERYNGDDSVRKLVLLDAHPTRRWDGGNVEPYYDPGGDLYCMADYFNLFTHFSVLDALPENASTAFQYNFYYEDGSFVLVNVYSCENASVFSVNGMIYGGESGETTLPTLLEMLFWRLRIGDFPY